MGRERDIFDPFDLRTSKSIQVIILEQRRCSGDDFPFDHADDGDGDSSCWRSRLMRGLLTGRRLSKSSLLSSSVGVSSKFAHFSPESKWRKEFDRIFNLPF